MNLLNSAESRERQGDGRGPGCPGAVSSLRNHHKTSGLDLWIILPLCFFMGRKQLLPGLLLLRMATAPGVVTASSSAMLCRVSRPSKVLLQLCFSEAISLLQQAGSLWRLWE